MALRAKAREMIERAIDAREPFHTSTGSLKGVSYPHGFTGGRGELPVGWHDELYGDNPTYVVYSYRTPMAWYGRRGWVQPAVHYSVTTTGHQGVVAVALSKLTFQHNAII